MTSAQVVETSVNVISNSPSQDYTHPDDRTLLYEGIIVEKLQSVWNNHVAQKLGILKNYHTDDPKDDHKEINKYTF